MNKLEKEIINIVKNQVEFEEEINKEDILKEIGINSLKNVMIVSAIEEKFNFEFDLSELDPAKLLTVQDLIKLTEKYI